MNLGIQNLIDVLWEDHAASRARICVVGHSMLGISYYDDGDDDDGDI